MFIFLKTAFYPVLDNIFGSFLNPSLSFFNHIKNDICHVSKDITY